MTKMISAIFILLSLFSCSKTDTGSLVGKWYNSSIDTKKLTGVGCTLKDTTKLYVKDVNAQVYEFLPTGKVTITTYSGGTPFASTIDYKFENSQLSFTANGSTTPSIAVSNLSADGWRIQQDGVIYCSTTPTNFTEYLNFKKY
jgi:hypothetical protein